MGNGTVKTVKINRELDFEAVTLHALVCYNFVEGITDKEEAMLLASNTDLHLLGTIDWNLLVATVTEDRPSATKVDPLQTVDLPGDPTVESTVDPIVNT